MTPRRKQEDAEEAASVGAGGPADPPKKRASRAKKTAAVVHEEPLPSVLPPKPAAPPKPEPLQAARVLPVNMKIEPASPPVEESGPAPSPANRWAPAKSGDTDLSMPPKVLMQSRKMPQPEVEDILEEPAPFEDRRHNFLRPTVKTGLFKKFGIGFAAAAALVLLAVGYFSYASATVIVYPQKIAATVERVLNVSAKPASADEILGEVEEVSVAGEKTAVPSGAAVKDAVAAGSVILYNQTGSPVTLVPTTRLLTPDGILFRLKDRTGIPAHGHAKAAVYADKPGKAGEIAPTKFTIPGLPTAEQAVVYAKSDAAMTGGTSGAGGSATADELKKMEDDLRAQLTAQARDELAKKVAGSWDNQAFLVETMSRFVNVAPGETTDQILVRLTIRVRSVSFDQTKAADAAADDLKRSLTSDRQLVGKISVTKVTIEHADPKTGTATLRLAASGDSIVSMASPLFDASKLKGLPLKAVQTYFQGIEGVDHVEVRFWPSWIPRMPDLADHIKFQVAQ